MKQSQFSEKSSEKTSSKNILTRHLSPKILSSVERAYNTFSPAERALFWIISLAIIIISLGLFTRLYSNVLVEVPSKGGTYNEGIVGTPRFINPLLAISDADRDLTKLIYSGLLKTDNEGNFIPDLADSYAVSEDGLTYDFTLKDNLSFHDGEPLTSADIEFTIKKAQDPLIKSQKRSIWDGVTVNVIDDKHIQFILKQAYTPFLENTTIGILPKHIWNDIDVDQFTFSVFNVEPIGSGPYKIKNVKENSIRTPIEYNLTPFEKYTGGEAYIKKLNIHLFPNDAELVKAFEKKDIEAMGGVDPKIAREYDGKNVNVMTSNLPRIFGVFFNQNQNQILLNNTVRKALNISVDRNEIIEKVLQGYGTTITSPEITETPKETTDINDRIKEANDILEDNGWIMNPDTGIREKKTKTETTPLSFSLSTGEKTDLKLTAQLLKEQWKKIGVDISVNIYENGDLNQNIIRPRKYEALLFGEVVGRNLDLYPFWHSSQRNDPGLNIAEYANITADKALEDLRNEQDKDRREALLDTLYSEIQKDLPAIFLYSPQYTYVNRGETKSIELDNINLPSDRFISINKWYKDTNKVWSILNKNN